MQWGMRQTSASHKVYSADAESFFVADVAPFQTETGSMGQIRGFGIAWVTYFQEQWTWFGHPLPPQSILVVLVQELLLELFGRKESSQGVRVLTMKSVEEEAPHQNHEQITFFPGLGFG